MAIGWPHFCYSWSPNLKISKSRAREPDGYRYYHQQRRPHNPFLHSFLHPDSLESQQVIILRARLYSGWFSFGTSRKNSGIDKNPGEMTEA
jgi:hypothetical protein